MSFNVKEDESKIEKDVFPSKEINVPFLEGRPNIKSATPSVIRRGLCMVRDKGKVISPYI